MNYAPLILDFCLIILIAIAYSYISGINKIIKKHRKNIKKLDNRISELEEINNKIGYK